MGIIIFISLFVFILLMFYLVNIGAKASHFIRAFVEAIVIYFISNLPIIFLFWAVYSKSIETAGANNSYMMLVNGGEVFIYVSAILAPVVWALMAYFKEAHRVLSGLYLLALISILTFSAFSFQQARLVDGLNEGVIDNSALLIYFVSLALWFGALVYNRFIETYEGGGDDNDETGKVDNAILRSLRGLRS